VTTPASARGERLLRLYPFELAAWGGLLVGVGFLRLSGLNVDWVAIEYTIPPLVLPTLEALAGGVVLWALYLAAAGRSVRAYLRRVVEPSWLLLGARLWLACLLFTFTYFWMKVSVPLVNWSLVDAALWRLDRLLHFGFQPSIFWTELLDGTPVMGALATWYGWWITTMMFGLGFFCAMPDGVARRRFLLSTVLLWLVGAWIYTALPALGPIYAYPQLWTGLESDLPGLRAAQASLWENYQTMLGGRSAPLARFNPTRGVAALPSLHVGGHWLLALWARRAAPSLFLPALVATVLTFVASIATGWHYAVDGYAGILLAQGAYWTAGRWEEVGVGRRAAGKPSSASQ
jgi:hypothetical protein